MKLLAIALSMFLFITMLANASLANEHPLTAQQFVEDWLPQLDAGNYKATWASATPTFQAQVSIINWEKSARSARRPLGELKARELSSAAYSSELPDTASGDYIVFRYISNFSNAEQKVETITLKLVEGRWLLAGYFVRI